MSRGGSQPKLGGCKCRPAICLGFATADHRWRSQEPRSEGGGGESVHGLAGMPKVKKSSRGRGVRVSVTDAMVSVQDKLQSAIDRKLVRMEDRVSMWVCVPGEKGHSNYIYKIKDRLKADRFKYDGGLGWHKHKTVAPERAIGLSDAEKARCAANLEKARRIREARSAGGSVGA